MTGTQLKQRLAAILAADVAGYSRLMAADERATVAALDAARAIFRTQIESNQGRVIDMAGDSVLAVFETATGAVSAALAVQQELNAASSAMPEDWRMRFRIGVHLGDVIEKADGSVYGDGVNIAARLQALAEVGGITISDSVRNAVRGKVNAAFEDQGEQQVKNISHTVRAFAVCIFNGEVAKPSPAVSEIDLSLPAKPSIAVLPFTNMSGDPEQEYFADGMAEDLTTALSKIRWFFVVSRNSAFTYKGKQVEVKQAARELGVRYVLEGSVRKSGDRVRITAQLIDAISGHHVWAERYDRNITDIFAVQDEITDQVVAAIEPQLYAAEGIRARRKPPGSLDAWECVVRALSLMNTREKPDVAAARELLEKAIALDPGYAQAHSLFAMVICVSVIHGWLPLEDTLKLASDAAHKALILDGDEPWAHVALGYVLILSRRHADAIVACEKTLALNPNFAMVHYLVAFASCCLGKSEEALASADKADRLGPRDLLSQGNAGLFNNIRAAAHFVAGRYRDGIDFARKALVESPSLLPAHRHFVVNCALAGDIEDAKVALATLRSLAPQISLRSITDGMLYVRDEDRRRYVEGFRLAGLE